MKPDANKRVSFSVFCSKDLPVTFVFAPPAPVPLFIIGVAGASASSARVSVLVFIFCFNFFGLGGGAVGDRGVFSTCSSMFSMMMLMCDIVCYIYFNFLIEYINRLVD